MPRVNYSDEVYKKTEQVIGKPDLKEPSNNEEEVRHKPIDNTGGGIWSMVNVPEPRWTVEPPKQHKDKLPEPPLEAEHEAIGRTNKEENLAEIVQEESVYPS